MGRNTSGKASQNNLKDWVVIINGLITCTIALVLLIGGISLWFNEQLTDVKAEVAAKQEQMIRDLRGEFGKIIGKIEKYTDNIFSEDKRQDESIFNIQRLLGVTQNNLKHAKENILKNISAIKQLVDKNDRNKDEILILKQNYKYEVRSILSQAIVNKPDIAHNKYHPIENYQNPIRHSKMPDNKHHLYEPEIEVRPSDVIVQKKGIASDSMEKRNISTGVTPIFEIPKMTKDTVVPPVSLDGNNIKNDDIAINHISSFQYIVSWDQFNDDMSDFDIVENLINQHISKTNTIDSKLIDNIRNAINTCLAGWRSSDGLDSKATTITNDDIELNIKINSNDIAIHIIIKPPQIAAGKKIHQPKKVHTITLSLPA